ncbi:MAG: diacylglycerol kinase family protein [Terriglobales bacterium]
MRAAAIFGLGTSPANLKPFRAGSATEWIEGVPASSADADAILIFGGDGTIHRHLPALVRLKLPVLVVPAGSGNDFARSLNLHSIADSVNAWRTFETGSGNTRAIDLGTITECRDGGTRHYFSCVAGCGLDSAVARKANRMPRWLRRHGGYALGLIPTILNFSPLTLRLDIQDGTMAGKLAKPVLLAAFANTPFYGDGMRVAPHARMDDGKLDLCLINPLNRLKLLSLFPSVYFGRHLAIEEVEYSQTERVRVETEQPAEIYADGEYVCQTPVDIGVERSALQIIGPQE